MLVELPASAPPVVEDEMLGVVAVVVNENCDIIRWILSSTYRGVLRFEIRQGVLWMELGNGINENENRDDCESAVERWRGLSLRQYTPGIPP